MRRIPLFASVSLVVLVAVGALLAPAAAHHEEPRVPVLDWTAETAVATDAQAYVIEHADGSVWLHWTLWDSLCAPAAAGPARTCNLFLWGELTGPVSTAGRPCPVWGFDGEFRMYEDTQQFWSLRASVSAVRGGLIEVALFQGDDPAGSGHFRFPNDPYHCPRLGDEPIKVAGGLTFTYRHRSDPLERQLP
ncbi:MAG TPA: hypothetical protein VM618_11695 [Acidimicrobiia bacterium]|nr:hypothetical protein [Acidimicrobiia bacterium]